MMPFMLVLAIILSILMLLVLFFDIRSYLIPNWLVGAVLAFYPALLMLSPIAIDWKMALASMLGSFVVGFILFSSKVMGGGDVKLLAACCLWTGTTALPTYLLYTSGLGGILSILLLAGRPVVYTTRRACAPISPSRASSAMANPCLTAWPSPGRSLSCYGQRCCLGSNFNIFAEILVKKISFD